MSAWRSIWNEPLVTLLLPGYMVLSWSLFRKSHETGDWMIPVGMIGSAWAVLNMRFGWQSKTKSIDVGCITMGMAFSITAVLKWTPLIEKYPKTHGEVGQYFQIATCLLVVANYIIPLRCWKSYARARRKAGKSALFMLLFKVYCLSSMTLWFLGGLAPFVRLFYKATLTDVLLFFVPPSMH